MLCENDRGFPARFLAVVETNTKYKYCKGAFDMLRKMQCWIANLLRRTPRAPRRGAHSYVPQLEHLEDRATPAMVFVDFAAAANPADQLNNLIANAKNGDVIGFENAPSRRITPRWRIRPWRSFSLSPITFRTLLRDESVGGILSTPLARRFDKCRLPFGEIHETIWA